MFLSESELLRNIQEFCYKSKSRLESYLKEKDTIAVRKERWLQTCAQEVLDRVAEELEVIADDDLFQKSVLFEDIVIVFDILQQMRVIHDDDDITSLGYRFDDLVSRIKSFTNPHVNLDHAMVKRVIKDKSKGKLKKSNIKVMLRAKSNQMREHKPVPPKTLFTPENLKRKADARNRLLPQKVTESILSRYE